MNTLNREDTARATAPVKEDPHLIVEQMRALEQALGLLSGDERGELQIVAVLQRLRHYFLTDLLTHLVEEEGTFIPAVESLPQGEAKAAQLRREHAELRQRIADFKSALTLAGYVGPQSREALLWRLVIEARALLGRLKTHAAYEYELVRELSGAAGNRLHSTAG